MPMESALKRSASRFIPAENDRTLLRPLRIDSLLQVSRLTRLQFLEQLAKPTQVCSILDRIDLKIQIFYFAGNHR